MIFANSTVLHKSFYLTLLVSSIGFSVYSLLRPGLSAPRYPATKMYQELSQIDGKKLITTSMTTLENDSSDRKASPLYVYRYSDGSEVRAAMVRVKKRDDFKIETYGLLTKNLAPLYIPNPISNPNFPNIAFGKIKDSKSIQTCIIPHTTRLDQTDIRLPALTSTVEDLNPTTSNFIHDKVLGRTRPLDYSCLVLTYIPPSNKNSFDIKSQLEDWKKYVTKAQEAMSK